MTVHARLLFVSACLAGTVVAQDEGLPAEELVGRIEAYLAPFLADQHVSGTVLIARGEDVVFERAYGMASHELGVANTVATRHCVASISKPMTKAIAIKLLERGALGLADTIDRWIEDFPGGDRITVEHLLRHRAGIPHRVTAPDEEAVPRSAADMVELARAHPPVFEPGSQHAYSSGGYTVLARVLELASGKSYSELLEGYVCRPAGLEATVHTDARALLTDRAQSYMPASRGVQNAPLKDMSFLVGAGSVYSTARDLFRLIQCVRSDGLGPSVRASLLQQDGGITWNGATNGFRAFADYHAGSGVSVVVTANLTTGAIDRMREDLPRIAAGEPVEPHPRQSVEPMVLSPDVLGRYTGTYEMRPGSTMAARVEGGELVVGSYVLTPTGEHEFFSVQDYRVVRAEVDDDGVVQALDWGGLRMARVRESDR